MEKMHSKLLVFFVLYFVISCNAHDHGHSHDHESEKHPAFKYSKEANLKFSHHQASNTHQKVQENVQQNTNDLWLYAIGSTLLISAAPFLILFVVPLNNIEKQQSLLKILLAFASGGLLGDAFLHLIPHAISSIEEHGHHHGNHKHEHHHEHNEGHTHDLSVGLSVLAGIVAFLVIEKTMRIIKGGHGHSHKPKTEQKTNKNAKNVKERKTEGKSNEIKVAGYLNLAADFSHNFTDGLAIGSSYLAGNTIGIVTTITILLHEVPHEIGDYAILLQSGVSRKNAMLLQLITALGALLGTVISLFVQDADGLIPTSWILPFTAGGFIYIALVTVIPELLDEEKPTLLQTLLQVTAMLVGIGLMVIITWLE